MTGRSWSALTLIWLIAGCTYYNAMWTAEHYASDARHLEERGQVSEARAQWALAASKAEAVVLRHVRDLTYAEVAEALGQPVGTVKANVHRGLKLLRGDDHDRVDD